MGLAARIRLILGAGILVLILFSGQYVLAAATDASTQTSGIDTTTLNKLEKKFFLQTFSDETVSHRLARLEDRVFGKTMSGTDGQRLSHLQDAAGTGQDAIFGTPESSSKAAPVASPAAAPVAASSATPATASLTSPANSNSSYQPSTNSQNKENERLRVQEAAEKQINTLLGEGVTAWRQHNADLALDRFKQVVRLDPLNSQAYFSLGIIYEAQGDVQKALENYQTASKLRPNAKDYSEAIVQVQKKLAAKKLVDEKQAELSKMSADALAAYNRGEYLSALDMYKQIDNKFSDQAINKYNIGSVYLVMHQPEMALPYYKKAKDLDPNNPKFSQAYDSLNEAMKQQQAKMAQASSGYGNTSGTYPSPAGPSRHDRHKRERENSQTNSANSKKTSAYGYIKNYGLEVRSSSHGLKVKSVVPGTRAAAAKVQSGDLIESINGMVVNSADEADRILSSCNPMRQLQLTIQRGRHMLQMML